MAKMLETGAFKKSDPKDRPKAPKGSCKLAYFDGKGEPDVKKVTTIDTLHCYNDTLNP